MTLKSKIFPIPLIPQEIIEAINNDQFAIFFGAGASMMIGCSSWERMAENLIEKCFTTLKKDNPQISCISFKEREALLTMKDPKKIITICRYILSKNGLDEVFFNQINESLKPKQDLLDRQNIYNELSGLRGLFITTNIDTHFDSKYDSSRILFHGEDFNPKNLDGSNLYHIHGSVTDWSTVIITVKDYFGRYQDRDFIAFLKTIFEEKTILFIGSGLNEFEILDFLITKSGMSLSGTPKHFILLPYYQGEDNILEFEEHYFLQLGISVVPFMKDGKGYGQLFDVIKKWNQEILLESRFLHDTYEELKNAANNYNPQIEGKIFQLIKNDKSLESKFFLLLSKAKNPTPWLKPINEHGYFDPKHNPSTSEGYGSFWNVMGVLENVAKSNNISPSEDVTQEIIQIINSIIEFRDEYGNRIENLFTDRLTVRTIFLLPLNILGRKYLDFTNDCLHTYHDRILIAGEIGETIVPRLIENKNIDLLLGILDQLLDFEKSENPIPEEYVSVLGEYYLQVVLEKSSENIIKILGLPSIEIALRKIESIVLDDQSQFNIVWIPSINVEGEFKDRYDTQIIHFIWTGIGLLGPSQVRDTVSDLLKKEHSIFKRIAISAINEFYTELNDLFWNIGKNPLDDYYLKHELYEFFNQHCKDFSDQQIKKVIEWIETQSYPEIYDDRKKQANFIAIRKKEWLSALIARGDTQIETLYKKYQAINPTELKHPGRDFVIESLSASPCPVSAEELLGKTNVDIVQFLNDHSGDAHSPDFSSFSLREIFRECIVSNPQKFVQDLDPFQNLNRLYQYVLFLGLSEAWRKGNDFKWAGIFQFINSILESEEFWTEDYGNHSNYRDWIVSRIASLIEDGTRDDSHLFEIELLPEAERILLLLVQRSESNLLENDDLLNSVLNSTKGHIYSAILNYSLCFGRHNRKDSKIKWPGSIKKEFDNRLDPSIEPSVEFSVTLGQFLPNLCYLDKEWVINNINRIFPKENETHWNAAFTAYLFHSRMSIDFYLMLKENGHFKKSITSELKDPHSNDHLVHHICFGYMEGIERIDDEHSLISQLLVEWNFKQILTLIRFFKWYGKKVTPEKRQIIFPLWDAIFSKAASDQENSDNKRLLSELNDWICLVDDLNEVICDRLIASVKYINLHNFKFVEELIRLSERYPPCTGKIFLSAIEVGQFFDFQEENIQKFVTILYENGEGKKADAICNQYLRVGYEFLIPIYEKSQNQ